MNWWRKKKAAIAMRPPRRTDVRLDEWRRSEPMVTEARRVLDMPAMKSMIDVLHGESPSNYQLAALGISQQDRAALQAKTEGYHMCLDFLHALGVPIEADKPALEATFEPPEEVT